MCGKDLSTNRSKVTFESHNSQLHFHIFSFSCGALMGPASPYGASPLHSCMGHATLGRNPLDEWSARRREFFLTIHNAHKRQTSMHPVEFEPTIPANERPQTQALDRTATEIGVCVYIHRKKKKRIIIGFRKWASLLLSTTHRKRMPFIVIDYVTFRGACAV